MKMKEKPQQETPADVYSLIRSPEVREYFRENVSLGVFEKEQIILHSYIPVQQKADMLSELMYIGNKKEAKQVYKMYRFLTEHIGYIYHPPVRTVFLLETGYVWLKERYIMTDYEFEAAFDTVDDVINRMQANAEGEERSRIGLVSVLQVPQKGKSRNPFYFHLHWIDGRWQIKDITITEESEWNKDGINEGTIYRLENDSFYHPLPFEDGSRLKLQMPFMEEPFYGILWSGKDGNGCWYHFLYDENIPKEERDSYGSIFLTYAEINIASGYSSLDWIERA